MKQILLCTIAALLITTVSLAQITITQSDVQQYTTPGTIIVSHIDTATSTVNIGSPGQNNWNFSNLQSHMTVQTESVDPSSTPYHNDFPGTNIAFHSTEIISGFEGESWVYQTVNSSEYTTSGVAAEFEPMPGFNAVMRMHFNPAEKQMIFPMTLNSNWDQTFTSTATTEITGLPPSTVTTTEIVETLVDAYGNMTLPGGVTVPALRIRSDRRSIGDGTYVRTISYMFLAENASSVSITTDTTASNSGNVPVEGASWTNNGAVDVKNVNNIIPTEFKLKQNYPNPFNPATTLEFSVPEESFVKIVVYNIIGKEVGTIVNENVKAGNYKVTFDASKLSSGIYIAKMMTDNFTQSVKMTLMR